jgi:dihydroorotase-like cyclic amidohydrolase
MVKLFKVLFFILFLTNLFFNLAQAQSKNMYDIVLKNGRVIDPETKLDAIRNVGIINNRILQISTEPLQGKEVIDVSGLVVAPGFIDLHAHGRSNAEQEYQLHDGVTTSLELEWGIEHLGAWYESRTGKALINFGASVCWPFERLKAIDKFKQAANDLREKTAKGQSDIGVLMDAVGPAASVHLNADETARTLANIKTSLAEGGIGIGAPIGYLPTSKPAELYSVFNLAAEINSLVYTHVRNAGITAIQEVITDAMLTKAPLHIVHINSVARDQIQFAVDMVNQAQKRF